MVLTVLSSFLIQSCLFFTNVTSALEIFLNVMRYTGIDLRFTYFYLLAWLWAYKAGNISETVEDRAKVNGLYIIVHGRSIAAKMYNLQ